MHGPCELSIRRAVACPGGACAVSPPGRALVRSHRMCLASEVKSQRRRQILLEMTSARSGWEIEFKRDGESTIFAWTERTSSVKWAVSALPSGAHPANLRRKLMRKVSLTLAIALLFAGSAALTADAQTSRGANDIAGAAQNSTPIEPAACRGWGPYCRPGFVRVCGRFRCWCRPCW